MAQKIPKAGDQHMELHSLEGTVLAVQFTPSGEVTRTVDITVAQNNPSSGDQAIDV
jgi:hypothetical protein